jgi:hypothetical protein
MLKCETRPQSRSLAYGSLFGSWSVKVVNVLDRCSKDALDVLLTYLDRMKPDHTFLGTINLDLGSLTERFQTRFQSVRLQPPDNEVLAAFLARRWSVPIATTRMIAAGAAGNVRAAMAAMAFMFLDVPEIVSCQVLALSVGVHRVRSFIELRDHQEPAQASALPWLPRSGNRASAFHPR